MNKFRNTKNPSTGIRLVCIWIWELAKKLLETVGICFNRFIPFWLPTASSVFMILSHGGVWIAGISDFYGFIQSDVQKKL